MSHESWRLDDPHLFGSVLSPKNHPTTSLFSRADPRNFGTELATCVMHHVACPYSCPSFLSLSIITSVVIIVVVLVLVILVLIIVIIIIITTIIIIIIISSPLKQHPFFKANAISPPNLQEHTRARPNLFSAPQNCDLNQAAGHVKSDKKVYPEGSGKAQIHFKNDDINWTLRGAKWMVKGATKQPPWVQTPSRWTVLVDRYWIHSNHKISAQDVEVSSHFYRYKFLKIADDFRGYKQVHQKGRSWLRNRRFQLSTNADILH